MKKIIKIAALIVLSYVAGFIIGNMVSHGHGLITLLSVPVSIFLFIAVFALIFSVVLHELGHFFWFRIKKIPVRLISIFTFTWINDGLSWKFQIHPNSLTIFGGIVIPDLPSITNSSDYKSVKKSYSQALLAAPIISIMEIFISAFLLLILYYGRYTVAVRCLAVFFCMCAFFGLIIVASSFIKTDTIYGDFCAYKEFSHNDIFAALQIYEYMSFANDWKRKLEDSMWLEDFFIKHAENCKDKSITIIDIKVFDWLLHLNCLQIIETLPNQIIGVLNNLLMSGKLFDLPACEDRDIFFYHLIFCFEKYRSTEKNIDIKQLYLSNKDKCFNKHPSKLYYEKLAQKFLYGENDEQWFENKKNIKPNTSYSLLRIFESCREIEGLFI